MSYQCSSCNLKLDQSKFSKKEKKKGTSRRCSECANKPITVAVKRVPEAPEHAPLPPKQSEIQPQGGSLPLFVLQQRQQLNALIIENCRLQNERDNILKSPYSVTTERDELLAKVAELEEKSRR